MWIAIIVLSILVIAQWVLFFFLHGRVEKTAERTEQLVEWSDLLNDNQVALHKDLQRVTHEVQVLKKEK